MRKPHTFVLATLPPAALALGIVLPLARGVPLMEIVAAIALYALMAVVAAGYLLRAAVVVWVVLGLYRLVRGRWRARIQPGSAYRAGQPDQPAARE